MHIFAYLGNKKLKRVDRIRIVINFCIEVGVPTSPMPILVTIVSGFWGRAGVKFPTFQLPFVVVIKTLRHYRARL